MEVAMDVNSFLVELVDIMETILSSDAQKRNQEPPVAYWTHIMEQLDTVGWERVVHMEPNMTTIQLEIMDGQGRQHIMTVCFPPGYPAVPFTVDPLVIPPIDSASSGNTSLDPKHVQYSNRLTLPDGSSLYDAIIQTEKKLDLFQDFWNVMQDFDTNTWVIDPEKPTRTDRVRRCALGKHCSIQINIDPLSPRMVPETRLFGPAAVVEPLRTKLYNNISLWDETKLPRENLEKLLELEDGFPSPISTSKEDMQIECGICYSFRYDGQVPDQICGHSKCQRPYHRVCLYEWLRSLPTTRQSFHTLFGQCPYCNETITTTAPKS
ncbi:hypothetical protein BGZ94_008363 [Podila epigama]|nr:hypothetical protein BGZ94_008363 [Podila epigama]